MNRTAEQFEQIKEANFEPRRPIKALQAELEALKAENDALWAGITMSKRAEAEYTRVKALKGGEK